VSDVFSLAKANGFALPAVNCVGSNSMNAVMETAAKINSPVIIQFSNGGAAFNAGKGLGSDIRASVLGAIAAAHHVRSLAQHYGAVVILHTDHAAKKLLPWVDGMLDAGGLVNTDGAWNWDFRDDQVRNWANKDWPIHMVFWNNATVNRVKGTDGSHRLDNDVFKTTGGAKWARFEDDGFWEYDADSGRKKFNCKSRVDTDNWTEHFRVYADPTTDRNWVDGWGFYVLVTTHFDQNDPSVVPACQPRQHGWDELAADNLAWYFGVSNDGPKWQVMNDWGHFHNAAQVDELIGGVPHHRDSNGLVTLVHVP